MKRKLLPLGLKGRLNAKQLLALLLSLVCVLTCTVGALIGFTFASDEGKLKGASPGGAGAAFGNGVLRAYLAENPNAAAIPLDSDTLRLVVEVEVPAAPAGGGEEEPPEEPFHCGCAPAVFCGGDACLGCTVCDDGFCGDGVCEFVCEECGDPVPCGSEFCPGEGCEDCDDGFCGDGVCLGCQECKEPTYCGEIEGTCDFKCICAPAIPCDCEEGECACACDCCEAEEGEEAEEAEEVAPLLMDGVTLYAELPAHIRDYFTLNQIETMPAAAVLTCEDEKYELYLAGPLEEGALLQLVFVLTFNREKFNETPPPAGDLPMLENTQAFYDGEEPVSFDAPTITYPQLGTQTDEELSAAMSRSVTRPGEGEEPDQPVTGKYVQAGDLILYEITIANDGEETIPGVVVEAPIPGGTSFIQCVDGEEFLTSEPGESPLVWEVDVPPGGITLSFLVSVDDLLPGSDHRSIEASATVNGSGVSCEDLEQNAHYESAGALSATLSASPAGGAVSAGWPIVYTILLTNEGEETLTGIPVRCTLPAGTSLRPESVTPAPEEEGPEDELRWVIDSLAPGVTVTITFTVEVQELPGGSAARTLEASAFFIHEEEEKKIGTVTHTQSPARLTFEKSGKIDGADVSYAKVSQGDTITYTVSVTNTGGSPAYVVNITDALPENLEYVAGSATGEGTPVELVPPSVPPRTIICDVTANGVTDEGVDRYNFHWIINQLLPGETAKVSFEAQVTALPETLSGRTFRNVAHVEGEETNPVSCWQPGELLDALKLADPPEGAYVRAEDTILYTVRVSNVGAHTQYDVDILDELPEGTQFDDTFKPIVTLDGTELACAALLPEDPPAKSGLFMWSLGEGTVRFVVGEIPVDGVAEATFRVKVLAPEEDSQRSTRDIENTAAVRGKNTNKVTHIQALHGIAAVKYADPADGATVYARKADNSGTRIIYSIKVTNTSDKAKDVEIQDKLPEGLVYVPGSITDGDGVQGEADESGTEFRWLAESLAPGESVTVQFKADVSQLPGGAGRDFVNSALVDGHRTNDVTHHQYPTSLRAEKSADPAPGLVEEDGIITYAIEVENTGSADEFKLRVFDKIPEGTQYVPDSALLTIGGWRTNDVAYDDESLTWIIPELEAGASAILTFRVRVLPLAEGVGMRFISNQAQVGEGGQARMTNTVTHWQGELDLAIKKSADKTRVAQNGIVTYTITVTNKGAGTAAGIPVSDSIPAGMTYVPGSATKNETIACDETKAGGAVTKLDWTISSLAAGAAAEITFQAKADALENGAQSRIVNNVAKVNGTNTNTVAVEVYSHLLTAAPPSGGTVQIGDTITYKIGLYNAFETNLPALKVVDTLPAGTQIVAGSITGIGGGAYVSAANHVEWNIPALPFGPTELTFQVKVLPDQAGGEIRNKALVHGYGGAAEETNEVFHKVALPDLFAVKSADRPGTDILRPGDTLAYTITVHNNTDKAMKGVPVLDSIPAGTAYAAGSADKDGAYSEKDKNLRWTVDVEPQGKTALCFKVAVDDIENGPVTIQNKALYGQAGAAIPDIFTNQVTHTAAARAEIPGLEASLSAAPGVSHVFRPGEIIIYTISVSNTGDALLEDLLVTCPIPAGTTYSGTRTLKGGALAWDIESLKPGETRTFSFDVKVDKLPEGQSTAVIVCQAAVACGDMATRTQKVHRYVGGVPEVKVTKGADVPEGQVKAGQNIVYSLRVENKGDAKAEGITVRDVLPLGVRFSQSPEGSYDAMKREVSWTIPSLEAGKSKTLTFTAVVNVNLGDGPLSVKNKAYYIPGAGFTEAVTNEITHTVPASTILPPALAAGSGNINIGNGILSIGSGNINSGNINSGNNSGNSGSNSGSNSGNTTTGSKNTGSIGGKDIPKTSEASALWAVILTLSSGAVAAAAMLLIRKKKALARKH